MILVCSRNISNQLSNQSGWHSILLQQNYAMVVQKLIQSRTSLFQLLKLSENNESDLLDYVYDPLK